MQKIITDNQARLLEFLQKQDKGVSKLQIMKALAVGDNTCDMLIESLTFREFILRTRERDGRKLPFSIAVTDAGRLALEYYNRPDTFQPVCVPPPKRCVAVPILPMVPFYRNSGHKHIGSRGVRC